MSQDVADTLTQALRVLQQRGRTVGTLVASSGCVCPLGAIALVRGYKPNESYDALDADEAVQHLAATIAKKDPAYERPYPTGTVYRFNDNDATHTLDVYAVFEDAIASAGEN